jgi:hypothetical protein
MISVGGKFTANLKIGGGGSGNITFIIVPTKVERYNIAEKRITTTYFELKYSTVLLPYIDMGVGIGGGATVRIGLGLIWGTLSQPQDFYGTMVGASGNLALGFGNNIKAFALVNNYSQMKVSNFVVLASYEFGPTAEASIHFTAGQVIPLEGVLKALLGSSGSGTTSSVVP